MLTDAVSLQNDEMLRRLRNKSFSNNRSGDPLKTCQRFSGFVTTKKTVVPILLPYKRKLLESHAIPKNCPIYFSMIKKMPLNILQQKTTDIHRLVPAEVSEVIGLFCFFLSISLIQKLHPDYRFKNKNCCTKLVIFHNLDLRS